MTKLFKSKKRWPAGIAILILIFSFYFFPKKSEAVFGVGDVVFDPTNTVQNTLTAGNTSLTAFSAYSLQFKEYVLDGLGLLVAKQIIRQITSSVVNWINSGFDGSPSFVQNPGAFFLDVADQMTGDFLAKAGGPLTALCSPFSIDIRIALAFKYRPNVQKRYACTLGTIITNSKNAVKNASINGFTAGDFKQGGWPAFVSLTTEPQNNIYGAYLTAESELSFRVANAQVQKRDEISAGKGFLSWRDPACVKRQKKTAISVNPDVNPYAEAEQQGECPIKTPGTVIESALNNHLGGPLRELELADEINEVVNALFAQLVTQVLQNGLTSVSQKNNGSSYLDQTISELKQESNPQVASIKAELLKNIDTYKNNTSEYKRNRDDALNIMLDIKNNYEAAKSCYQTKINLATAGDQQRAQARINEIDSIINTQVSPRSSSLLSSAQDADYRMTTLQDIQTKANAAITLNDLNEPSQKYAGLIQSNSLTTAIDIQKSRDDLEQVRSTSAGLKQDAVRKMQQCQLFPNDPYQ